MGNPIVPGARPSPPSSEFRLVVVLGPTASGKSALAMALAERFDGEIINCDSVALVRGLDIGAAKPSTAERRRVPHHLLDIIEPDQPFTAGDYSRAARAAANDISSRGKMPIVAGGTGLYLRALLYGLFPGPPRSEGLRQRLRARAAAGSGSYLHRLLQRLDPAAAKNIHAKDAPKLIRAIEVCLTSHRPITEMWQQGRDALTGYSVVLLGLDPLRAQLYDRINERAKGMFEHGLLEETRSLIQRFGPGCRALASLGYKQAAEAIRGECSLDEAIAAAQQGHRNYAKRQMTWFRREPGVQWLRGFGDQEQVLALAIANIPSS